MSGRRRLKAPNTAQPIVYFVQGVDGGPIKIGVATDPKRRLATLQHGSPVLLRALIIMPGGFEMERQLHRLFAAGRMHGEWFDPDTPGLMEYIQEQRLRLAARLPEYKSDAQIAAERQAREMDRLIEKSGSRVLQMVRDRYVA